MVAIKKSWLLFILLIMNIASLVANKSFSYPTSSPSSSSYSRSTSYSNPASFGTSYRLYYHNQQPSKPISSESLYTLLFVILLFLLLLFLVWLLYHFLYKEKKVEQTQGNKDHVYKDYEKVAAWFQDIRSQEFYEKKYLDQLITYLKPDATILDLGCGMGKPITQYCIEKKYTVTGVDGSEKLIRQAQHLFPQSNFIIADMRTLHFSQKFDAIILWHSFFHLSQQDQRKMFLFFKNHLKPDGILLFTSGPYEDERWSDNVGIMMYHASLSALEYKNLLTQHHFELLLHVVEDKDCGDATVWMAQYKEK